MGGVGRHRVLGLWSTDPLLAVLGAIGLGSSAGTALVIDLCADEPGNSRSLADIAFDGPSLDELSPGRRGLAFLIGGPIEPEPAIDLIHRLSARWPAVVVRLARSGQVIPTVPVVPLYNGRLAPAPSVTHAVWQPTDSAIEPPGPGPVLPRLRPWLTRHLLDGRLPRRSKWIESWGPVWEMPWE